MAPRREILDSDDDDDSFSPVRSTANCGLPGDTTPTVDGAPNTANTRETGSTDSLFFQSVYDEQQTAADGRVSAPGKQSGISDDASQVTSPTTSFARLRRQASEQNTSSLTSVTDPRNRPRRSEWKDVVDLTQITTPGRPRPSDQVDLWDVPSSPAAQTARNVGVESSYATNSFGKRKRGQNSSPRAAVDSGGSAELQSPTAHSAPPVAGTVHDKPTRLARKNTKREPRTTLCRPSQEIELVTVPGTGDNAGEGPSCSNPVSGTVVKDTSDATGSLAAAGSASLYVAQSVLSASQKQQYEFVSLSSEVGNDGADTPLPGAPARPEAAHISSGATTIAYPTPSQYASSAPRISALEATAEPSSSVRRRRSRAEIPDDPPSSPDVIAQPPVNASRKRKRDIVQAGGSASAEAIPLTEPLSSNKTTTRRSSVDNGLSSESHLPSTIVGPSRSEDATAETGVIADRSDAEPSLDLPMPLDRAAEELSSIIQDEPKPKKKRGRKKKEVKCQVEPANEHVAEGGPDANEVAAPLVNGADGAGKVKRKRGRPRKSDTTRPLDHEFPPAKESEEPHEVQDTAGGQDPPDGAIAQGEPALQDHTLKELDQNSCAVSEQDNAGTAGGAEVVSLAKDSQLIERRAHQETGKGEVACGQSGKVQYRVGLSKRSRIAPLLKSLRK